MRRVRITAHLELATGLAGPRPFEVHRQVIGVGGGAGRMRDRCKRGPIACWITPGLGLRGHVRRWLPVLGHCGRSAPYELAVIGSYHLRCTGAVECGELQRPIERLQQLMSL